MKSRKEGDSKLLEEFSFDKFRFKQVEVVSDRMTYRGMFLGADDKTLFLKGRLRYLLLPLDHVRSVRLGDERQGFDPGKSVPADFYRDEPGPTEETSES